MPLTLHAAFVPQAQQILGGMRGIVDKAEAHCAEHGVDASERGHSGGASTGLGLDIARRTAESTGGSFRTSTSPSGGAAVTLTMPLAGSSRA